MALSADTKRAYGEQGLNTLGVKASARIYEGSAVGLSGGYARALVAADKFAGFALENVLGTTDGAVKVAVQSRGLAQLSVTSVAVTNNGAVVYASDDGTFVLTSTGNSPMGRVHRFVSSGIAVVSFDSAAID
jgi:hypothetical protein